MKEVPRGHVGLLIQYHLYVLEKIRKGLEDVENGRTIPHEEVRKRLAKWLTR